jgi:formamidopyrimidine-DNA glycosylase
MPEGPEVWILSKAINTFFKDEKSNSYGKHLFILDKKENWSFGLTGKVQLNDKDELIKINSGWLYGEQIKYENIDDEVGKLGIDFMTSNENDIKKEVDKWIKSKKKLAGLLLDQSKISGIGVAWGSEILFKAGLRPDMRTCDQNLKTLADSILYIREKIKNIYEKELKDENNNDNLKDFINEWFSNLYEIREMEVYKKGSKLEVLGRSWWV